MARHLEIVPEEVEDEREERGRGRDRTRRGEETRVTRIRREHKPKGDRMGEGVPGWWDVRLVQGLGVDGVGKKEDRDERREKEAKVMVSHLDLLNSPAAAIHFCFYRCCHPVIKC